jgi:hypothetical protein
MSNDMRFAEWRIEKALVLKNERASAVAIIPSSPEGRRRMPPSDRGASAS